MGFCFVSFILSFVNTELAGCLLMDESLQSVRLLERLLNMNMIGGDTLIV